MALTTSANQIMSGAEKDARGQGAIPEQYWALVEEYRGVLVNQAYAILGNAEDAEDTAQETFCEAVRHPAKLAQARSLGAWLRSINKAHALNRLRERQGAAGREAKKREERAKRNFTTGGMSLVEMREALAQAIDALPKRQREVMVLRYWEGCSFEDIAARLKLPLTGVWRLHLDASMHLHRKIGVLLNPGQSQRGKDNA